MKPIQEKGVLRPRILASNGENINNITHKGVVESCLDYSISDQSRETIDVSRPSECGSSLYQAKIVHLNQQYLGSALLDASIAHRFLGVKSEKGTGKTTAAKKIIASCSSEDGILLISPRKKLNRAMASDLNLYYYEDVKAEKNRELRRMMMRRMTSTPQGLALLLSEFPQTKFKFILIDESEATASMLVSKVTDNKEKAIASLKNAASKADAVRLMDAAYSDRSQKLMNILKGDEPNGMLNNSYKRWAGITANIIEGGRYADRKDAINALQSKYANDGKRFAVSSSSAEYCELRAEVLKEQFPHLKIGLFTAKSSKAVQAILDNPEKVSEIDIAIFSPAISIGVSFDIKEHFSTVFGVYTNSEKTASSDDAVQGLARVRHPSDCEWIIALDDDRRVLNVDDVESTMPDDIAKLAKERFIREHFATGTAPTVSAESEEVASLWGVCESHRIQDKNNYKASFLSAIKSSGVTVVSLPLDELPTSEESEALTEQAKEKRVLKIREAKSKSEKLTDEQYEHLKAIKRFRPDEVTQNQLDSMARYRFEQRFGIDCDTLPHDELEQYLEWDENDVISQCTNREQALASSDFVKKLTKARIEGLGGTDAFKVDIVDARLNFRMRQKLLAYAVPYFGGKEYSHASLKANGSLVRFVERHHDEIVLLGVVALPNGWRTKPALLMNKLLSMCGYEHYARKERKGKKLVTVNVAQTDVVIQKLCDDRAETGRDWVTSTKRLMGLHDEIIKTEEGRTRLEKLWYESGRTDDMQAFMTEFKDDIQDIENGVYPDETMLEIIRKFA